LTCLAGDSYMVFAAAGNMIYAWRRGSELKHIYRGHEAKVKLMLPFGPHLISIDDNNVLKIFDIKSEEETTEIEFPRKSFPISCILHPPTYINKVLLGSKNGTLQLWNLRTCQCVHKFAGWNSAVTALCAAPAVDVAAVGLADGSVFVHNLRFDETIVKFNQDWGAVTSLSFRTDGPPALISASPAGHLAVWDLQEKRLASQLRDAHAGEVSAATCLPGEPLMVTTSADNSLKMWIFDLADGGARLLRTREGFSAPPTKIRFYGGLGVNVLAAGEDSSLRTFSVAGENFNKSFGVASYNRKLSKKHKQLSNPVKMRPIVDFTSETTRDRDWDNVACVHRDTDEVTTWSFGNQKMGELKLRHKRFKEDRSLRNAKPTCLTLTVCGNFVVIGYDSGHADKFNVQSGIHRGSFVAKGFENDPLAAAHPGRALRSVCADGLNAVLVTGDAEGGVKFWRFSDRSQLARLSLDSGVVSMEMHRDSNLAAVALADHSLLVLDVVGKKVVRRLFGHSAQITDLTFSADGRWLVSSGLDSVVRVWDVPSGCMVDSVRFPKAVTSLSMSPRGEFLATSHVGDPGVYLWTNVTLYSHIPLRALPESYEPGLIQLPLTSTAGQNESEEEEVNFEAMEEDEENYESPDQLHETLLTLANLPASRWKNLLDLDVIRMRNKPNVDAVRKPKAAPFFLPTVANVEGKTVFALPDGEEGSSRVTTSKVPAAVQLSGLAKALIAADTDEERVSALAAFKNLGPAAVETELRALAPEQGGAAEALTSFLLAVAAAMSGRRDFEAVQAYLALFLKLHSEALSRDSDCVLALEAVCEQQEKAARDLSAAVGAAAALAGFCRNAALTSL